MQIRKKVLLIQLSVSSVREEIYNFINDKYDLTVMYTVNFKCTNNRFEAIQNKKKKFLKWNIYENSLVKLSYEYDVIIFPFTSDINIYNLLYRRNKNCKLIVWGIGVRASYAARYDENNNDRFHLRLMNKTDAALFYTDYPKIKYAGMGQDPEKMFVANNTVPVKKIEPNNQKNSILFLGTLYPQKKVYELCEAYKKVYEKNNDIFDLNIIGDGTEYERIHKFIIENGLDSKIHMTGAIYDDAELVKYFADAYACFSPDQAGLSVLKSMGYGVPFVTTSNAITGGERFNISNGINGVLINRLEELSDVIEDIYNDPGKYYEMGKNAYDYYWTYRRPEQMAQGFIDAIDYVLT